MALLKSMEELSTYLNDYFTPAMGEEFKSNVSSFTARLNLVAALVSDRDPSTIESSQEVSSETSLTAAQLSHFRKLGEECLERTKHTLTMTSIIVTGPESVEKLIQQLEVHFVIFLYQERVVGFKVDFKIGSIRIFKE